MKILIDSREPLDVQEAVKKYPAFNKFDFTIQNLPAGDYWLCDDTIINGRQVDPIIVERKTVNDFLLSIDDKRIFNQASEMRSLSEFSYLCICGPLVWSFNQRLVGTNRHFRSVVGAMRQVQRLGVIVVFAADDNDFPATLNWLLTTENRNVIYTLWPRQMGVPVTKQDEILASLTGIGEARAESLLRQYGSVTDALIALTDDKNLPDKISQKIRNDAREALGLLDGEFLQKIRKD